MKVHKILICDQNQPQFKQLAQQHQTSEGVCGFITCAVINYISQHSFNPQNIKQINKQTIKPYMIESMRGILNRRRQEIKKFKIMANPQRINYLKNEVANYEVAEYLQNQIQKFTNKQVYFFRHTYSNFPQIIKSLQYQQAARIEEQEQFKGQQYFYTSFSPYKNNVVQQYVKQLVQVDQSKPILIATDTLSHFYTTVLFRGEIFILDSLDPYLQGKFDCPIVQCIANIYSQALQIIHQNSKSK